MSAQILPFTPRTRTASRREAGTGDFPAIVIFPGVRYERLPDDEDTTARPAQQTH